MFQNTGLAAGSQEDIRGEVLSSFLHNSSEPSSLALFREEQLSFCWDGEQYLLASPLAFSDPEDLNWLFRK